jgi:hypothetical protein
VLFGERSTSTVFGLRLVDGRDVVVKARADDGRAASCVAAQARLVEGGLPCARPLTPVVGVDAGPAVGGSVRGGSRVGSWAGSLAVHAEEFRPGGEVLRGDSPEVAVRYAGVFARLMVGLADVAVAPPVPNPRWVRWDHGDAGPWPAIESLDEQDQSLVPRHVVEVAGRVRRRLLAAGLPCVLGHADFEAHNLRWCGDQVVTVHDWDSLAWQPEAALVGAASAVFPKMGPALLPPVGSTEAFLAAYQDVRGRSFTADEEQVAWAASLWPVAHDVRWESLHGYTAVSGRALWVQAAERLRRAGA